MIVIKNKQGQAILQLLTEENASVASGVTAVPLNQGSIHHIELMTSEYIRLKFKLAEAVVLKAGCYVEHSLGHFVLDTDYVPEFDKSTGGYVYDVSVKAWYYSWNRYILKLNPEYGCREASFSLTDKISGHIAVFRKNLEKYFDSISLYVDIDSTIDQEKAVSVTYDGVHITDALSTLAEAYECEWWMEDGNHLHFGHCQRSNTPLVWTQDSNAELKRNDSSGQYATRLYVFGSTQNMPKRYRKSLIMYATEIDRTNKRFRDPSRKLSPGVFVASAKDGLKITTTAKWGGTTHSVVLNPGKVATEEASWIYCDELPDSGQSFTIDNILLGKVDASYLTSDYGDEAAIAGWENRLMLPKAKYPGNYIDSESVGTGDLVVEGIVTIDDVYPHKTSPVAGVTNYRTEEEDASDENGETKVTVTHYVLQLEKSEFSFSTDYLLPGQTLRVQFQSGKLAGMSFDLSFKGDKSGTTRQEYEVINNEDYGVLLPNTKLYPAAEDKIILSGYDVSYLSEEGSSLIAAAESKLEEEGLKVLAEQTKDKSTHTVTLKPSYAMSLETQICLGTRVSLQYIPGVTDVTSRVISIERAIDKPYDAPVYTVGESSTYSRLSELEGKLQAVTSQVTMIEPTDTTKIEQALNNYNKRLSIINSQLDESFQIWHVDYNAPTNSSGALIVPTVTTYEPSKSWTSTTYSEHEGDFVVTLDGIVYEFVKLDEIWQWKIVTDKYLVSAVTQINSINATLDNMASDSVITREEELVLQKIWAAEVADYQSLTVKVDETKTASTSEYNTALVTAFNTFKGKYDALKALVEAVFTTLQTSVSASINKSSWDTAWSQYWTQKVLLEQALSQSVTAGLSVRPTYDPATGMIQNEAKLYGDKVVLSAAHKMAFTSKTITIESDNLNLDKDGNVSMAGKVTAEQYMSTMTDANNQSIGAEILIDTAMVDVTGQNNVFVLPSINQDRVCVEITVLLRTGTMSGTLRSSGNDKIYYQYTSNINTVESVAGTKVASIIRLLKPGVYKFLGVYTKNSWGAYGDWHVGYMPFVSETQVEFISNEVQDDPTTPEEPDTPTDPDEPEEPEEPVYWIKKLKEIGNIGAESQKLNYLEYVSMYGTHVIDSNLVQITGDREGVYLSIEENTSTSARTHTFSIYIEEDPTKIIRFTFTQAGAEASGDDTPDFTPIGVVQDDTANGIYNQISVDRASVDYQLYYVDGDGNKLEGYEEITI